MTPRVTYSVTYVPLRNQVIFGSKIIDVIFASTLALGIRMAGFGCGVLGEGNSKAARGGGGGGGELMEYISSPIQSPHQHAVDIHTSRCSEGLTRVHVHA